MNQGSAVARADLLPGATAAWYRTLFAPWYRTLFLTDMWERFGFYGMQAILVLYAAAPLSRGGLGLPTVDAAALFGAWIGLAFMFSMPGGWIGDRMLGPRRALLAGGVIIALGHFSLAVPAGAFTGAFTGLGLILLALGTGLYKPNHQAMINMMFGGNSGRRESGISLMYVGIQVSALLAPLITGYLGERVDWHLGFAVAGVAMLIGVVQLAAASRQFGSVGSQAAWPLEAEERRTVARRTGAVLITVFTLVVAGLVTGTLTPSSGIVMVGLLGLIVPVLAFLMVHRHEQLRAADRQRLRAFLWVFLGSALFWMTIAQDGSVLTLFARDSTDLDVAGFTLPVSWLLSATPLFILFLAPCFAWGLPRIRLHAAVPTKFALGLLLAGTSFVLMSVAAAMAADGTKVSPWWLFTVYLMHASGELIIAAVSISAAADVLPPLFLGQTLGLLWLFAALGGGLGSQVVRLTQVLPLSTYFLVCGLAITLAGLVFAWWRHAIAAALGSPPEDRSIEKGEVWTRD
ncbi:MAG: peptide MFS transporter [Pseudonocardiaceae bacterium]